MSETNVLYATGANKIIAGGMVLSAPIVRAGQSALLHVRNLLGVDLQTAEAVQIYDISRLFSEFFSSSDMAAEIICKAFSSLIRENSLRPEIKSKTTNALANEIRAESFKTFDVVLSSYATTMQKLGIDLESRSTIGAAVDGALTGGGLQFLTTGKTGKSGAIVGALIFAAIENAQKEQLRQELVNCALSGMKDLITIIPQLSDALMDQYATLIFGSEIDFKQRDTETGRTQTELKEIANKTEYLLSDICSYSDTSRKIGAELKRKVFIGRKREFKLFGVFSYSLFWKEFRKNPLKAWIASTLDPYGKKYAARKELQEKMNPELNTIKRNMETSLAAFNDLEQKAKRMLA